MPTGLRITVEMLLEALEGLPRDAIVMLAFDGEGNGYAPLEMISSENNAVHLGRTVHDTEIKLRHLTQELRNVGYTEEDVADPGDPPCIILWPAN